MGSSTPMIPVLQTRTSSGATPTLAAAWAVISMVSFIPCSPTHALAQPLLATTARAWPDATRCSERVTEAERILFVVKVPAAVAGDSERRTPTSSGSSP